MVRRSTRARAGGIVAAAALATAVLMLLPTSADGAPATLTASCSPNGTLARRGNALISDPLASQVSVTPLALALPVDATAPASVGRGGSIAYRLAFTVDLERLAADTLATSVKPAVESGALGVGLTASQARTVADSAALNLRITGLTGTVPLPPGSRITGTPTATASAGGPSATASVGPGGVSFSLGPVSANAKQATSVSSTTVPSTRAFTVTLAFSVVADAAERGLVTLRSGPLAFSFAGPSAAVGGLNVSIDFGGNPISGGIDGAMTCSTGDSVLATTQVGQAVTSTSAPTSTTRVLTPARADAVRRHAPTLRLAPGEPARPTSVDQLLRGSCLKYHFVAVQGSRRVHGNDPVNIGAKPACGNLLAKDQARLGAAADRPFTHLTLRANAFTGPVVAADDLTRPMAAGRSTRPLDPAEGFVLDVVASGRRGPANWATAAPLYVETGDLAAGGWYARYFYLHGADVNPLDPHEGDWESVAVRFTAEDLPISVAFWQRTCAPDANHPALVVAWDRMTLDAGTHPQVLVAKGSHTPYPWLAGGSPSATRTVCGHPEVTETVSTTGGVLRAWAPGNAGTVLLGSATPWYGYGGAWGQYADRKDGRSHPFFAAILTGPLGPSRWLTGPPPTWR